MPAERPQWGCHHFIPSWKYQADYQPNFNARSKSQIIA